MLYNIWSIISADGVELVVFTKWSTNPVNGVELRYREYFYNRWSTTPVSVVELNYRE